MVGAEENKKALIGTGFLCDAFVLGVDTRRVAACRFVNR